MHCGPFLDSGDPYSAISMVELNMIADHFGLQTNPALDPITAALSGCTSWQYETGNHASQPRNILESIMLTSNTDNGSQARIRHSVLVGSSQCVVGRNVTSKADIENIGRNALVSAANGKEDLISIKNHSFLSFIKLDRFLPSLPSVNINNESTFSCMSANFRDLSPWTEVKSVVNEIRKHLCGHAPVSDYNFCSNVMVCEKILCLAMLLRLSTIAPHVDQPLLWPRPKKFLSASCRESSTEC